MATELESNQARSILRRHGDDLPASLRAPLMRVREGTEVEGTAADVLQQARRAVGGEEAADDEWYEDATAGRVRYGSREAAESDAMVEAVNSGEPWIVWRCTSDGQYMVLAESLRNRVESDDVWESVYVADPTEHSVTRRSPARPG